jgi:hypothetical protein
MKLDFEKWNLLHIVFYIILGYHAFVLISNLYLYSQDGFSNVLNIYNVLLLAYTAIWGCICIKNKIAYYAYIVLMAVSFAWFYFNKSNTNVSSFLALFPANALFSIVLLINFKAYFNKK